MSQISRMSAQFGGFPDGYCPASITEMWQVGIANTIITPGLGFTGINYGPTAPENTDLPWFNTTQNDWYYWSTVAGEWLPVRPVTITGEVQIGTVIGWDGQISLVNQFWGDRWLFANGDAISRTLYPDYFGLVGTKWGPGDGSTTFNIIDMRNNFWVGADLDVAGEATTSVGDGSTPLTERAYEDHKHRDGDNAGMGQGHEAGGSYTSGALDMASTANDPITIRVLPPYKALVPIVRVK